MFTPYNLTKAAQTTFVQARGLDKLDRPTILTLVKVTTLNTEQHLPMLGGSTNSSPSYLSRLPPLTSNNLLCHWTTSFTRKPAQSLGAYELSKVHKIHVASYVTLRDMRQDQCWLNLNKIVLLFDVASFFSTKQLSRIKFIIF